MKKEFEDAWEDFFKAIKINEIPNISLYMDQVTTFMEEKLDKYKRTPTDKIMTKTMINNYTKDKLLPPPDKKKYTPAQMMQLIMIFHLKQTLSITDIGKVLNASPAQEICPWTLYEMFTKIQENEERIVKDDIDQMEEAIKAMAQGKGRDLNALLLALSLAVDSAVKKQMAEHLIDHFLESSKDN